MDEKRLAELRRLVNYTNQLDASTDYRPLWPTTTMKELLAALDATRAENSVLQGTNAGLSDLAMKYLETIDYLRTRLAALEKAAQKIRSLAVQATSNLNVNAPSKTATLVEIDLILAALLAEGGAS